MLQHRTAGLVRMSARATILDALTGAHVAIGRCSLAAFCCYAQLFWFKGSAAQAL